MNNNDTRPWVVVPTYNRPQHLRKCLDHLSRARGICGCRVFVSVDRPGHKSILDVVDEYYWKFPYLTYTVLESHPHKGNSFNVFSALREVLDWGNPQYIYLVEEDIYVGEGFFDFFTECMDGFWAGSAVKNQNYTPPSLTDEQSTDPRLYYGYPKYQSLGVCLRPSAVKAALALVNFNSSDYWDNPVRFVKKTFPSSKIPPQYAEQDGIFDRLLESAFNETGATMLYPVVPRAYHAGEVGYHEGLVHKITPCDLHYFEPTEYCRL